jgi:hypothetical protein
LWKDWRSRSRSRSMAWHGSDQTVGFPRTVFFRMRKDTEEIIELLRTWILDLLGRCSNGNAARPCRSLEFNSSLRADWRRRERPSSRLQSIREERKTFLSRSMYPLKFQSRLSWTIAICSFPQWTPDFRKELQRRVYWIRHLFRILDLWLFSQFQGIGWCDLLDCAKRIEQEEDWSAGLSLWCAALGGIYRFSTQQGRAAFGINSAESGDERHDVMRPEWPSGSMGNCEARHSKPMKTNHIWALGKNRSSNEWFICHEEDVW